MCNKNNIWKSTVEWIAMILPIVFFIGLLLFSIITILSQCSEPHKNNASHTSEGEYESAYSEGYEEGLSDGEVNGFENGYDEGYDTGYDEGYSDGENDGYYAGSTYVCLFYGDVDRAFRCAKNGAAWHTFVEAYDEYISNIYDNEDEKVDIVWALVSATSGESLSYEDAELLIRTFGAKLFSNNGIILKQ